MNNTLTALKGVQVGHATHLDKLTGCTFVLFDEYLPVAFRGYGGAVGSYNTGSLRPGTLDNRQLGIFVAGGSSTGLMSASDIMQCMIEDKVSKNDAVYNPSICGAVVYDQGMRIAPYDPAFGREAYQNLSRDPVASGNVGAGTGVCVGKFQWLQNGSVSGGMKAGVGNARVDLGNGIIVTAMTVLNAIGNIVLPDGTVLAGNRDENKTFKMFEDMTDFVTRDESNTTISIVGINADLGAHEYYDIIAHQATLGQARAIYPVNTRDDGDSVFVFSTREIKKPLNSKAKYFLASPDAMLLAADVIGHAAARAVQDSIYDACRSAETVKFDGAYNGEFPSV